MRNRFLAVGMITAGLWPNCAGAQDVDVPALQMKACTLINDAAARVRCYDRAMSRPQPEPQLVVVPQSESGAPLVAIPQSSPEPNSDRTPEPAAEAAPSAAAKPETPSLFGLGTIIQAVRPSSTPKATAWRVSADKPQLQDASRLLATLTADDEKTTLVLQCKDNATEAYVSTDRFLGWESMRVQYRVNEGAAIESRWAASRDGRGAVVPAANAVDFINSLGNGGILLVRVSDYNGTNHDLRFNLGALSDIRSEISLVCRWPGTSPSEQTAAEVTVNSRSPKAKGKTAKPAGAPLQLH